MTALSTPLARGLPRILLVVGAGGVTAATHGVVQVVGGVVLVAALLPGWRGWWRYVTTGVRDRDRASEPAEEFRRPGERRVVIVSSGPRGIDVVKAVREVTPYGFRASKQLVESVPSVVATDLADESARLVSERLRLAGADCVVEPPLPADLSV